MGNGTFSIAKLSTEDSIELVIGIVIIGIGILMVVGQWLFKPKATQ